MTYGIILLLTGIISILLIIFFKMDIFELQYEKFMTVQIGLGVISSIAGLWEIIDFFAHINLFTAEWLKMSTLFIVSVNSLTIGIILLTVSFLRDRFKAKRTKIMSQKEQTFREFLVPLQGTLSIIAIGIGICQIVVSIIK